MKRIVFVCLALFALVACRDTGPRISDQVSPGGIAYTLVEMPGTTDVAFQIAWASDWATRAGVNQVAPYIGAQLILAGGAEGYAPGQANELMTDINAEASLTASVGTVYGTLIAEKGTLDQALPIARAHLVDPALDPMWFGRVRDSLQQNVSQQQENPGDIGFYAARWSVFGDTPLRRALSLDDAGDWQDLTVDDVAQWRIETLSRSPAALVVAGDLDADHAGQAVDQMLEGLPEGKPVSDLGSSADFTPKRILFHMPAAKTTHLGFIAPIPPTREGGEFEDMLLVQSLGQGDQSALFDAVRTGLRASYDFGAGVSSYTRDHRFVYMFGAVDTDKLAEAETVVREAYVQFREAGATDDPVQQAAPLLANVNNLPNLPGRLAYTILEAQLDGFPAERALGLAEELEAVTVDSLNARLETAYPAGDQFIVIAVSSDATALPGACVITEPAQAADCP